MTAADNLSIANALDEIAELLEAQAADAFRLRAYRTAAENVRRSASALSDLEAQGGTAALEKLPGIGHSIAALIAERLHTGRIAMLERLRGQVSPEDLFTSLPGIGDELAARLHRELGLETLEELELAAHDGRLLRVRGFGRRRAAALRDLLAARLSRTPRRRARLLEPGSAPAARPGVPLLLEIDREYRRREHELPKITPRRFNPRHEAWLPVLHTTRDGWHFTVLYSNSARAHELGKNRDWVILYFERDGLEGQCTVVTDQRGALAGQRVVRGREDEQRACVNRPEVAS